VKLKLTAEDQAFREEVRGFLKAHLPPGLAQKEASGFHLSRADVSEWQRTLYHKGWVAPNWPKAYGGTGWSPMQKHIFDVECGMANVPEISLIALSMVGPVLCRFGSTELQRQFLEPMLRGDIWFCQGFSEPQAGSDLANVGTKAVLDGDEYVITGRKTWTTAGHMADYMICLCRTDATVKPQAGLSMILLPMDAKGVECRPIATIDDDHTINEVFLDDVRVPRSALVGEPNSGWTQAKFLLSNERTHNAYVGMLKRYLARIARMIRSQADQGLQAAALNELTRKRAKLEIDVDGLEWSVLRVLAGEEGPGLNAAASALKIRGSEYLLRAADLEMEVLGPAVALRYLSADTTSLPGWVPTAAPGRSAQYLYWWASTIFGGSNEIQRSIIWNALSRG